MDIERGTEAGATWLWADDLADELARRGRRIEALAGRAVARRHHGPGLEKLDDEALCALADELLGIRRHDAAA